MGKALTQAANLSRMRVEAIAFPISSTYRWQDKIQIDQEWQLIIKSTHQQFEAIENLVKSLHSYDLPEIIALPVVEGHIPYLNWVQQNSNP